MMSHLGKLQHSLSPGFTCFSVAVALEAADTVPHNSRVLRHSLPAKGIQSLPVPGSSVDAGKIVPPAQHKTQYTQHCTCAILQDTVSNMAIL